MVDAPPQWPLGVFRSALYLYATFASIGPLNTTVLLPPHTIELFVARNLELRPPEPSGLTSTDDRSLGELLIASSRRQPGRLPTVVRLLEPFDANRLPTSAPTIRPIEPIEILKYYVC
ncbi:uncharacterized protein LOC116800525 [Drosophila sechellia]|uniref:uncharacterized protein LOC116800525 n=1 Tax=Drosophila sechellia TaxID=7238 RepID=UPI0013DE1447|nr:uncharacterized protein LOC116800525 [Drosophila sechellia]